MSYLLKALSSSANTHLCAFYVCANDICEGLHTLDHLSNQSRAMLETMRNEASRLPEGTLAASRLIREMNRQRVGGTYEPVVNSSQFLSIYCFAEGSLYRLCSLFHEASGSELTVADLRGGHAGPAACYLKKVVGVQLPYYFEVGAEGDLLRWVRNRLAHLDGRLTEKDTASFESMQRTLNASTEGTMSDEIRRALATCRVTVFGADGAAKIRLTEEFNRNALALVHIMFMKLLERCERKMCEFGGVSEVSVENGCATDGEESTHDN